MAKTKTKAELKAMSADELLAYVQNLEGQRDSSLAAEQKAAADLATAKADHEAALATKDAERAAALQAASNAAAQKDAEIAEKQALIEAMGGTAEGQRLRKEAAKAVHRAAKEAAEKALAELEK